MKTELCTVYSSEWRDNWSSWRAGAWPCQWIVTRNQLPLENSIFSPYLCRKDEGLLGWQQIVLPMYSTVQYKNYTTSCPPAYWGWTFTESIALYVKLWSRLKTNRWQSYGVMKMYTTGICLFHRSVANCDRWVIYKAGQLHCFYCNICSPTNILIKVWKGSIIPDVTTEEPKQTFTSNTARQVIQSVQLKSGPSTQQWIFHVRCYL